MNAFWEPLEHAARRLDTVQTSALALLPKRPSQKALRLFEVSVRVAPGSTPDSFVQIANLETLTQGVSAHAALQRAQWHAEVMAIAQDVRGLLEQLHTALLGVRGLADARVLAVDATPKIEPTTLWFSTTGHVMAAHNQGFTVADGAARRAYTSVLETRCESNAPTWLLSLTGERGFTTFDSVVFQVQADSLEDALLVARLRYPHRFCGDLAHLHAARLVETQHVELAKRVLATT